MEKVEYFVYYAFFITQLWDERFAQSAKGLFLAVPMNYFSSARAARTTSGRAGTRVIRAPVAL